jgi:UDP-glucose 4-epimerase
MNILTLGGRGFIGSNLAKILSHKHHLIIFDHPKQDSQDLQSLQNTSVVEGDIQDKTALEKLFQDQQIDLVINLISNLVPGTSFSATLDNLNADLNSTMYLIHLMKKHKVDKFIYFSSGGAVYGDNGSSPNREDSPTNPISYYGWTKLTLEKYILLEHKLSGLQYLILRPSNAYGPKQKLISNQGLIAVALGKALQDKELNIWGDGNNVRDYIHVNDVTSAVDRLIDLGKFNQIFNVGTGKGTSVKEVLKIIEAVTDKKLKVNYLPKRSVDVPANILDSSKLIQAAKWKPEIDLRTGIEEFWQRLRGNI